MSEHTKRPTRESISDAVTVSAETLERMDLDVANLAQMLKNSNGYQLTVTLRGTDNRFTHHQITNNFPNSEMLRCHKECKDLLVKHLEEHGIS